MGRLGNDSITEKTSAVKDDLVLIGDSENSFASRELKLKQILGIDGFYAEKLHFVSPNFPDVGTYHSTLTLAKTNAESGDTIIVYAGSYNEKNLLKNGVNWHFMNGASVDYVGSSNGGIFDSSSKGSNEVTVCKITGNGSFNINNSGDSGDIVHASNSGDSIYIEFNSATSVNHRGLVTSGGSVITAVFDSIITSDGTLDCIGGNMYVKGRYAESTTGYVVEMDNEDVIGSGLFGYIEHLKGSFTNASGGYVTLEGRLIEVNVEFTIGVGVNIFKGYKITTYGDTSGNFFAATSGTILEFWNCQIELNTEGIDVSSGAILNVYNSKLDASTPDESVINLSGGSGVFIKETELKGAKGLALASGFSGNVQLKGVTIIASGTSSITSVDSENVYVQGQLISNKAVDANTTLVGGSIIVNTGFTF